MSRSGNVTSSTWAPSSSLELTFGLSSHPASAPARPVLYAEPRICTHTLSLLLPLSPTLLSLSRLRVKLTTWSRSLSTDPPTADPRRAQRPHLDTTWPLPLLLRRLTSAPTLARLSPRRMSRRTLAVKPSLPISRTVRPPSSLLSRPLELAHALVYLASRGNSQVPPSPFWSG